MKALYKIITIIFIVAIFFAVLTLSISLPILFRPFYYMQISPLHIVEDTGFTREQIITAYNEMLDFCVFGTPFGTGDLAYSESGASHFADCKVLFDLDFIVLFISLIVIAVILILHFCKVISLHKFCNRESYFWSGVSLLGVFGIVGGIASIDFDTTFTLFHKIFFPGKSNWIFNPFEDEIILILPEDFFMNCAILIVASIIVLSLIMIIIGQIRYKKMAK